MTQTITAMYDAKSDAEAAMARLVGAGIPQASLKLIAGSQTPVTTSEGYDHTRDEGGFWASLKSAFMPEEDRYAYTEGLSRGGTMLSATLEESKVQTALGIMDDEGSIDLDEREASWRQGGWKGYAAGTDTMATAPTGSPMAAASMTSGSAAPIGRTDAATAGGTHGTDYIPVVEERLNVGKRMVDSGRVRVRSYAVAQDVSENVTLREETVHVDRRAVDRAPMPVDEALFADKTIEATEMREQAVVSKEARVVEEVGIAKQSTDRVETVTDKVRHTEVEVTDERGNVTRTGNAGTTTGRTGPTTPKPV